MQPNLQIYFRLSTILRIASNNSIGSTDLCHKLVADGITVNPSEKKIFIIIRVMQIS